MRSFVCPVVVMSASLMAFGLPSDITHADMSTIEVVRVHKQQSFGSSVPAGNYSGISWLGGNRYAVVSDKSATDGFYIFDIVIDSVSGKIEKVDNEGFFSAESPNRDQEGIAFVPWSGMIYVCGEKDNRVMEYGLDGRHTGRQLDVPDVMVSASQKYGIESITYNSKNHKFWLTTESTLPCDGPQASYDCCVRNRLRLQCFNDSLCPGPFFYYEMDEPEARNIPGEYAMGVSELCALDDGRLLVMEREFYVARHKLGSWVNIKLFVVCPVDSLCGNLLPKSKVIEFKTHLSLFQYNLANYEGMCLGPELVDGSRVLILVSDSQNQYGGVLKDYFKTIVIKGG